jgi:hypothetical protein
MSGGNGGPIIIHHVRTALSDPIVHGQLPSTTQLMVDAVLDKADSDWTPKDKEIMGKAITWCLKNLV